MHNESESSYFSRRAEMQAEAAVAARHAAARAAHEKLAMLYRQRAATVPDGLTSLSA